MRHRLFIFNSNSKVRSVIWICLFLVMVLVAMNLLANKMEVKDSEKKYYDYFNTKDEIDVVFLGTSHMIDGILPTILYEKYGITSYNLANHGELMPTSYWVLQNALQYHTPKVVVIDLFVVNAEGAYYNKAFSHCSLDAFPLTSIKLEAIWDLFNDNETRMEFINNFNTYHSRWNEAFTLGDMSYIPQYGGAELLIGAEPIPSPLTIGTVVDETMTEGMLYFEKILDFCDRRGIQVVCTNLPYSGFEEKIGATNYAKQILKERNTPCIDFQLDADIIGLNLNADFRDSHHLNVAGAAKATNYVGEFLRERYFSDNVEKNSLNYEDLCRKARSDIEYLLGDEADINHVLMLTDAFSYDMILEIGPYEKFGSHELTQSYLRDMGFEVFIPESSEISQRYSTFGDYAEAGTERNTAKIWIYDQNGELVTEREFLIEE